MRHESMNMENYHMNYDINKLIKDADYHSYACDYYTMLENSESKIALLSFK